uniref:VWFA domain-containing protein n=1 Tax=Astyanax mexicanus TaxID=7994 RepID=A0A3B1JHJ1_ASTMX
MLRPNVISWLFVLSPLCQTTETPSITTGKKKDVVFLIDGTTAMRSDFPAIRDMIQRVVEKLDIGLDKVRVAVVQYSEDPKLEFLLNEHSTKEEVRQAVRRIRSKGGRVLNTGQALNYVTKNIYQRSAGSRIEERVPQFLILVTGGKSNDDVADPASQLKLNLVAPLAVGSGSADSEELKLISLAPEQAYIIRDFQQLPSVEQFIARLNGTIIVELPPTPGPRCTCTKGAQCAKVADIVFLVDGSINLGKDNFKEVMEFIVNLIDLFFTEQDNLQIGLAHYASDVTDVFYLNTYNNKDDIINAIGRAEYKGGRRINTGNAIKHIQQAHFVKEKGSRKDEGVPQILMIVTGGRSQDDGKSAALGLKATGVRIYAVGVGDIEDELNDLGSETTTVARASTFQELSELNEQILETLDDEIMGIKLCTGVKDTAKGESIN